MISMKMTKLRHIIVVNLVFLAVQFARNNVQALENVERDEQPENVTLHQYVSSYPYTYVRPSQYTYLRPVSYVTPTRPVRKVPQLSPTGGRLLTPQEGCGKSDKVNAKIVGGTESKQGAFPWMALIAYKMPTGQFSFNCGGSLITSRHILTAAHCINPELRFVRLAEHDLTTTLDGPVQDIRVTKISTHESFSKTALQNDIAILTLERDVDFSGRVRPICLPLNERVRRASLVYYNPFVAGWGTLAEKGPRAKILQQIQVPILPISVCQREYVKHGPFRITDAQICAGPISGGKDSCQGDSGGPLMLPLLTNGSYPCYQIGLVSYGLGCARPNAPGVYTNVQRYMDWIKSKLN